MSLARLISVMDVAGVDLDVGTILDVLWLASYRPVIRSHGSTSDGLQYDSQIRPDPGQVTPRTNRDTQAPLLDDAAGPPSSGNAPRKETLAGNSLGGDSVPVYPVADAEGRGRRASPIGVATASPLSDSLGVMRALRPLQQRWPSVRDLEIDEEATAHLTAELRTAGLASLFPVLRPVNERWFEVDLVLEDDDAVELWRDLLKTFAQVLRHTGAFRSVREWRLYTTTGQDSANGAPDMLQAPSGGRLPVKALSGPERRVILFASHASSRHWSTGTYARLLTNWAVNSSVALLHLLPADTWMRTPLGEPDGSCSTYRSGAANIMLDAYPYWWSPVAEETHATVAIPMVELLPTAIQQWAAMLMGRGRSTPALILPMNSMPVSSQAGNLAEDLPAIEVNRRVATLLENAPKAFELAVLLTTAPFTIPVVRLIQEAHFGKADQRQISELFISGLIFSLKNETDRNTPVWYQIHPLANSVLRRSLRGADAESVAATLINRVSAHIKSVTGRQTEMTNFTLDDSGKFSLPDWAQPFALVASRLRTAPQRNPTAALTKLREQLSIRHFGRLVRLAVASQPLNRDEIGSDTWDLLLGSHLTSLDQMGRRIFTPTARDFFAEIDQAQPILGSRLLWVDDRPSNNIKFRKQFENEGASVTEVTTTREALTILSKDFDIIISDMGRVEGEREGFRLLAELKAVNNPPPAIIFAGGFATSPRRRNEAVQAGAIACTNDVLELRRVVHDVVRKQHVEALAAETHTGIFLSYSQKDQQIAQVLVDALKSLSPDIDVFFDRTSIKVGDNIQAKISDAIQTSQWFILVCGGGKRSEQDMSWSLYEAGIFRAKLVGTDETKPISEQLCFLYDDDPPPQLAAYAGTRVSARDRNNIPLELDIDDSLSYENTELFDLLGNILTRSAAAPLRNIEDPNVRKLIRNCVRNITLAFAANKLPTAIERIDSTASIDVVPSVARILVAGSGTFELPEGVRLPARILGQRLAFEGYDLVTGGWPGVDHIVATAFSETLRSSGREPGSRFTQVLESGEDPSDFTIDGAKIITLNDWATGSVEQSDVVVLIGGIGGTQRIFEAAIAAGKPAIPLGQSGGDAAKAMHTLNSDNRTQQTFLPKALQFVDLSVSSEPAATVAVDGVLDLIRLHLNPSLQRTYQALATVLLEIGASIDPPGADSARRSTLRESSGSDRYFSLLARAAGQPKIFKTQGLALATTDLAALALEPFARDQPRWLVVEFIELRRSTTQSWQQAIAIQLAIIVALLRVDAFDLFTDIVSKLKLTDKGFFERLAAHIIGSSSSQLLNKVQTAQLNEWFVQSGSPPIPTQTDRSGPRPIQIRFQSPLEFETKAMLGSIAPYLDWERAAILSEAPIEVHYPKEFIERLAVLAQYLASDKWPNNVMSTEAKSQVRDLVDNLLPNLTKDLTRAARTIIAALAISGHPQLNTSGLASLETYVRARIFSTARVLAATWLEGEPSASWRAQFDKLDTVWSNRIIYGITWVLQDRLHATFWADADLDVGKRRARIFVPQKIGAGRSELEDLSEEDCCRILIPQMLDEEEGETLVSTIVSLLRTASKAPWVDLVFRGESIIETETHNFPSGNWDAKERATRIAARYVADQLRSLPKRERARQFRLQMVEAQVLPDLREKVIEIASDIADDL